MAWGGDALAMRLGINQRRYSVMLASFAGTLRAWAALLIWAGVLLAQSQPESLAPNGVSSAPFFGDDTTCTTSSILVKFNAYSKSTGGGGDVEAYEVSMRSLYNTQWSVLGDRLGSSGRNVSEVQIVSIRVNQRTSAWAGPRLSGTFRLGIERQQTVAEDFQMPSVTPRIPFDATADQMKEALGAISSISIRDVKRCDEITVPGDPGAPVPAEGTLTGGTGRPITSKSGFEGWVNGCPYNAQNQGGYKWLIVFDIPAAGDTVPKLIVFKNELTANSWTPLPEAYTTGSPTPTSPTPLQAGQLPAIGSTDPSVAAQTTAQALSAAQGVGPQILVTRVTQGMVNPSLCFRSVCAYNATGLVSGTPYTFRTRVLTGSFGWSDYSMTSPLKVCRALG